MQRRGRQTAQSWTKVIVVILAFYGLVTVFFLRNVKQPKQGTAALLGRARGERQLEIEVVEAREQLRVVTKERDDLRRAAEQHRRLQQKQVLSGEAFQPLEIKFPKHKEVEEHKTNGAPLPALGVPGRPVFSVVLVAQGPKGDGETVVEAIHSVVSQGYPAVEVVLVDDGCQDSSSARMQAALDKYSNISMHYVRKPLAYAADARNRGIEVARGEWLFMLDAEDRLGPHFLEKAAALIANDSSLEIVLGCVVEFGGRSGDWCFPEGWSLVSLTQAVRLPASGLVRRDLMAAIGGFDPAIVWGLEEWDFWLAALAHSPRVQLVGDVMLYEQCPGGACARQRLARAQLEEAQALVRTNHPLLFEAQQLLWDHETIAAMAPETLNKVLEHLFRFPAHPLLSMWRAFYWESQGQHEQAIQDMQHSITLATFNSTHPRPLWQQHFWLGLFFEAAEDQRLALHHINLASREVFFDALLQSKRRLEEHFRQQGWPLPLGPTVDYAPRMWTNEAEQEEVKAMTVAGKLVQLAELVDHFPHARQKYTTAVTLLKQVHGLTCPPRRTPMGTLNLVLNGHFPRKGSWFHVGQGLEVVTDEGRKRTPRTAQGCLRGRNADSDEERGAQQAVHLNQAAPKAVVVSGWSKAKGVTGAVDANYALQVDVNYADGSQEKGFHLPFAVGDHEWEHVTAVLDFQRPVASLDLRCMFAHHAGWAWFDDISVAEVHKVACQCSSEEFFDPVPGTDCAPCPLGSSCAFGVRLQSDLIEIVS